ncbi:hypothetical protein [Bacillus velezensis]|uniref:hypothetical protein n=2 Tax=Bacillaceae TaxID=186817 RepID=UPI00339B8B26
MIKLSPEEIDEIAKEWENKGNPPCDHSQIGREYTLGAHTDYACLQCGERR